MFKVFLQGIRYLDGAGPGPFAITNEQSTLAVTGLYVAASDVRCLRYAQPRTGEKVYGHPFSHRRELISFDIKDSLVPNIATEESNLLVGVIFYAVGVRDFMRLVPVVFLPGARKLNDFACCFHDFPSLCFSIEVLSLFGTETRDIFTSIS